MRRFELDFGSGRVTVARSPSDLLTQLQRAGALSSACQQALQQLYQGYRSCHVQLKDGLYVRVYSLS